MATATLDRPNTVVTPEVIIIDDGPSLWSRIGGWFADAFGWVRNAMSKAIDWGRSAIAKIVSTLHLDRAWSFVKEAAVNFGPLGWISAGVAMVTTQRGRDLLTNIVVKVMDGVVGYTCKALHWLGAVTVANWIEDRYVALKVNILKALAWVGSLGGGRVGRFFDPAGKAMRFVSTVAIIVAGAKFSLMIPMPLPLRLVLSAVGLVMVGLGIIAVDQKLVEEKAADVKAAADEAGLNPEQKSLVEAVADYVGTKNAENGAAVNAVKTATQKRDYPAQAHKPAPRSTAKATTPKR